MSKFHINHHQVLGNVVADAESKLLQDNVTFCIDFKVAASRRVRDAQGNYQNRTQFFNVKTFCRDKEHQYLMSQLKKGRECYAAGESITDRWTKDGQPKYFTYIDAKDLQVEYKPAEQQPQVPSQAVPAPATDTEYQEYAQSQQSAHANPTQAASHHPPQRTTQRTTHQTSTPAHAAHVASNSHASNGRVSYTDWDNDD